MFIGRFLWACSCLDVAAVLGSDISSERELNCLVGLAVPSYLQRPVLVWFQPFEVIRGEASFWIMGFFGLAAIRALVTCLCEFSNVVDLAG